MFDRSKKGTSPDFLKPVTDRSATRNDKAESQQLVPNRMSIDRSLNKVISQKTTIKPLRSNYLTVDAYIQFEHLDQLRTHRGPLNLDAITMRDPNKIMDDLCFNLTKLRVSFKRAGYFNIKCEYLDMKFAVEMNAVEKFPNLYGLKFYKNTQTTAEYFDLCSKIFGTLQL